MKNSNPPAADQNQQNFHHPNNPNGPQQQSLSASSTLLSAIPIQHWNRQPSMRLPPRHFQYAYGQNGRFSSSTERYFYFPPAMRQNQHPHYCRQQNQNNELRSIREELNNEQIRNKDLEQQLKELETIQADELVKLKEENVRLKNELYNKNEIMNAKNQQEIAILKLEKEEIIDKLSKANADTEMYKFKLKKAKEEMAEMNNELATKRNPPANPQCLQPPFAIPANFTIYGGITPEGIQFYGSIEALTGYCMQFSSPGDGNCFFHSIASQINDDPMLYQILRDIAATILIEIDTTWTAEDKERIIEMIGAGVLLGDMAEFEKRYGRSISNYARNYSAQDRNYVGSPEAVALAKYLQRPIAVITPPSNMEMQRQFAMGNPAPPDMVFVYLPDCTTRQYQIPSGAYEQLWMLEREPITIIQSGINHFDGVQWFG